MKLSKNTSSKESSHPLSMNGLYKNIQKSMIKVEEELNRFSRSKNPLISEINSYLFHKSGKRIRPALLVLCSKLYGYKGYEHIFMGALVEAIHTASLIHDDIIDNSDMRRGRQTVHSKWGPNISVLLGDYLYIKTIGLSLESHYREIIQVLTNTSAKMIEGELTEYYMSGNVDIKEQDYLDIIQKKTASLFSASCQMGAILGNASPKEKQSLADFGMNLGMCFQIIDDLLDYTGNEKDMGKPVLSDAGEGRITLPLIYTLNNDGKGNRKRLAELLKNKKLDGDFREEILKTVQGNGALDYTYQKAKEHNLKSKKIIHNLSSNVYREDLLSLSDYILHRKK